MPSHPLARRASFAVVAAIVWSTPVVSPASAQTLPAGFQETIIFTGLVEPTVVRFAADGRIFVAEKRGVVKLFDGLTDTTPTVFADLNANVYNFWDRGLLGMELHPNFPATPYVYVLYTYDFDPQQPARLPRWGTPGVYNDPCPTPPGPTGVGCVVTARVSRLEAAGNVMTGAEQPLIEDWCQQYPSHSIGGLAFGADGALYVSGGDGASFNFVDYGQDGAPLNPCGDPPSGVGGTLTPPTAEGGALRSQDLRTADDPVTLDGTILRVDPITGEGLSDNPLSGHADANARRIVAYGLRNPFNLTVRPGTNDIWIGDVGWNTWEEINRIVNPVDGAVRNFGWPCYEGSGRQGGYDAANLAICENLYAAGGAVTAPVYTYNHADRVVSGETCPTGSSSISGLAFYEGGSYPAAYAGALFFSDYSRDCIWVMFAGADGLPDPAQRATMVAAAANPVDLRIGPGGDLFYVDFNGGTIRRITFFSANQPPTAMIQTNVPGNAGLAPLTVTFDGRGSSDPDPGDQLTYAWDLDGDGQLDDAATACCPTFTYTEPGTYRVTLRVTDRAGVSDPEFIDIVANNSAPVPTILSPGGALLWSVGDAVAFNGSATDPQDGTLPASRLSWSLILHHCPSTCHQHPLQSYPGVASGSFTTPDHEYPSHLELRLTAVDSTGLQTSTSVLLQPRTTVLTFRVSPVPLQVAFNGTAAKTPFQRTVIVGSQNTISAASPQKQGSNTYNFVSWSDGGAQIHTVIASTSSVTFTATFQKAPR
jgi:glucose/arabinose dehydrogenase/PKD repeat protein